MSEDLIDLEVSTINAEKGKAILSDGQEVPITDWFDEDGEDCCHENGVAGVCGPDFDGYWYVFKRSDFEGVMTH